MSASRGVLGGWLGWLRSGARACFSGADTPPRRLVVEERLPLAPKHCLYLVRCGSERFLLATGGEAAPQWIAVTDGAAAPPNACPEARTEARAKASPAASAALSPLSPEAESAAAPGAAKTRRRAVRAPQSLAAGPLPVPGSRP